MSTTAGNTPTASTTARIDPARVYRKWQQLNYPLHLWWAIACFIALVSLQHLVFLIMANHTQRSSRCPRSSQCHIDNEKGTIEHERGASTASGPASRARALRNLPSAALSSAQLVLFRLRLPFHQLHRLNLTEALVSIGYLAALLIWSFIHSRDLTVSYWANRTAHLATSQTPLIVALAGKNNIITLLTGIGYEKLNVLHRASARSTLILIWAHGFGRWKIGLTGHWSMHEADMRFGVVAMAAFSLATVLSIRPIRNMAYEAFLISHIILVAMYLIFGLFHVPEVKYRFWPALVIWALDRLLRGLRLIVLNRLWLNIFPGSKPLDEATLERVSNDTVRLTVRRSLEWKSGQHAYILAPSIARLPFEAHPFTIASACSDSSEGGKSSERDLVFIIRARDGFTQRLFEASETRGSIPVAVDGPYGAPPRLYHYSTCILLAGGSGVSYTLPLLLDLVNQVKLGKAVAQRICFVWIVRDRSHIEWIAKLLQEAVRTCPPTLDLDLNVHVTQSTVVELRQGRLKGEENSPVESKQSIAEKSTTSLSSLQSTKVLSGRPNIASLFEEELRCSRGCVSIDVSGPSALADAAREALVACEAARPSAILRGVPRATLHVETFGW